MALQALQAPSRGNTTNMEYFKSPESMQGFEQVRQWLEFFCKKVSIVKAGISE